MLQYLRVFRVARAGCFELLSLLLNEVLARFVWVFGKLSIWQPVGIERCISRGHISHVVICFKNRVLMNRIEDCY